MERLSKCCNAKIHCNTHNRRNVWGVPKTWTCSKCGEDASIPRSEVLPPPPVHKYDTFTTEHLEDILNQLTTGIASSRPVTTFVTGTRGKQMFEDAMKNALKEQIKGMTFKFRSESGKIVEISWEQYSNLKQETKDKLAEFRIE